MISSASEIVAYIVSGVMITKLSLKLSLVISFSISLAGTICYIIFANTY